MTSVRVTQILSAVESAHLDLPLPGRLVRECSAALEVSGVGLVLMNDSGPSGVVAASDGPAQTMEDLQFTLGEGPCVDSSRSGRPVLQPDLATSGPSRWPAFSSGALDAGIRAIFAFPLRVGGIRLGVLDLYRDAPGDIDEARFSEALDYADAATVVLLHLQAHARPGTGEMGNIPVLEDRAEVHQATGVVSVQAGVSLAQALVLLRARAFSAERPILHLARDVLRGTVSFAGDDYGYQQ